MSSQGKFIKREDLIKRSIAYAVAIILLTAMIIFFMLTSQETLNRFLNFQAQIIFIAGIVLVLAIFVQIRQTTESTTNAKMHKELENTNTALEESNRAISEKKAELERDVRTALMVQQAVINRYQPDLPGIKIATRTIPAANVGGDFYQFIKPEPGHDRLDIIIGDVAGHGVPASLITILTLVLLEQLAKEEALPSILLLKANTIIEEYLRNTIVPFVTVFYGTYAPATRSLKYAVAGHPAPLLKRNGQWQELSGKGVFLGTFSDNVYEEKELEMQSGDLLVLYTDGVTETKDQTGQLYGSERLQQAINEANSVEPSVLIEKVFKSLSGFSADSQEDDRTLLVLAF
ncbi:MAG: PP2C family protein-serine/threonine phosphatase [Candidatus Margulisiibacteriota bacterium]|jgi:sigma-B regulation protein RsbU (phosphoserine phosphatase)